MFTTATNPALTRQEIYSTMLLTAFDEFVIDQPLFRDYTAQFPDGDELKIPQVGDRSIRDRNENTPIKFSGVDTSRLVLRVTENKEDGFYMTDEEKEDSYLSSQLFMDQTMQSAQAFKEVMQSDLFAVANTSQTPAAANTINGQPHRLAASGAGANITLEDIAQLKLSFDKAKVPTLGRILLIDATQEFALNTLTGNVVNVDNPQFRGIAETGFAPGNHFVRNIFGFDIWVSDLLPRIASETVADYEGNNVAISGGVANLAMYVGDDSKTAMMGVMRRAPTPEFYRNVSLKRDEWSATARYGYGLQRPESLSVLLTSM